MNNRGSLLIAGLWAMSIFSVMTASLTFHSMQSLLEMKRERQGLESKVEFVSALNEVTSLIQADPLPHEDSPNDLWFGDVKLYQTKRGLEVQMTDEESKINLNQAGQSLLNNFFKEFEESVTPLKGSRKDYVKGIVKMRSVKALGTLEDLLLMENFENEDLENLRPYLTVYPDSSLINLNTASPIVISALINSLQGDHGASEVFASKLQEACKRGRENDVNARGCLFLSDELNPERFTVNLKLPKSPEVHGLEERFLAAVTTDSETFSIRMKSQSGKEARAVFRSREGALRPEVMWWHED